MGLNLLLRMLSLSVVAVLGLTLVGCDQGGDENNSPESPSLDTASIDTKSIEETVQVDAETSGVTRTEVLSAVSPAELSGTEATNSSSSPLSEPSEAPVPETQVREEKNLLSELKATPDTPVQIAKFKRVRTLTLPGIREGRNKGRMIAAGDYIYDSTRGILAFTDAAGKNLVVVPIDSQTRDGEIRDATYVRTDRTPMGLAFCERSDGGLFFVSEIEANTRRGSISVISAETLKHLRILQTPPGQPAFLPDNGEEEAEFIYYTTTEKKYVTQLYTNATQVARLINPRQLQVHRIKTDSLTTDRTFSGPELQTTGIIQSGGRMVYYNLDFNCFVVDQSGKYIAYDNQLCTADLDWRLTDLDFKAKAFVRDAWIAGVTDKEIVVGSMNDGRVFAREPLPAAIQAFNERRRDFAWMGEMRSEVFYDQKRDCLIVGMDSLIMIIPIKWLELPEQPILLLKTQPPRTATRNEEYEYRLETESGMGSFKLAKGPAGMTIEDRTIKWTPRKRESEPTEVMVRVIEDGAFHQTSWFVTID